jgi:hypothetical protein
MSERIRELAEQARDWGYAEHSGYTAQLLFEQKFAELIVQECIDIIAPYTVRMSRPGEEYLHPIQEIQEHFGVQE